MKYHPSQQGRRHSLHVSTSSAPFYMRMMNKKMLKDGMQQSCQRRLDNRRLWYYFERQRLYTRITLQYGRCGPRNSVPSLPTFMVLVTDEKVTKHTMMIQNLSKVWKLLNGLMTAWWMVHLMVEQTSKNFANGQTYTILWGAFTKRYPSNSDGKVEVEVPFPSDSGVSWNTLSMDLQSQ